MFVTVKVESWKDARSVQSYLQGWRFRGHTFASWHLSSRLEREAKHFGCETAKLANRERWILREFRRRAHHYLTDLPEADQLVEWLALIQHHGGPTRLLDFSCSFYVAAFFAMESATEDAAIWAIDTFRLSSILKLTDGDGSEYIDETNKRLVEIAHNVINAGTSKKTVLAIEPERMNERLSIQQGVFLFPCDIGSSFEQNIAETFGLPLNVFDQESTVPLNQLSSEILNSAFIVKVILPHNMHTHGLHDLSSMNITAATLFPGLDGFARSLGFYLRPLSVDGWSL